MNCEELMNIRRIRQGLKLRAGEAGLNRHIRWIYFADCMLSLSEDYNPMEYVYGEELVIITNQQFTDDEEKILHMIKLMTEKNIAGIVINEGQILDSVRDFCNLNNLPLFEVSMKMHLNDFSHIVCSALVEEESNENSKERLLSTILYSSEMSIDEVKGQADYLGVNLMESQFITIFKIEDKTTYSKTDIGKSIDLHQNIQRLIRSEFQMFGLHQFLMLWQSNKSIVLLPADFFSKDLFCSILTGIIKHIENRFRVIVRVGVGNSYEYIDAFRNSYLEAKSALDISAKMNNKSIFYYDELGIYSLIAQIPNEKFLKEYVDRKLGALIRYDEVNEGELLQTLETYLDCECNAKIAAEELFIHRNTMHYRMDKIKKVLSIEMDTMSEFLELKLAFSIFKYLN